MYLPIPRLHLFEIDDQPWFPAFLRLHVQTVLTNFWTTTVPLLQSSSPASLVARVLRTQLNTSLPEYTFVDFCAGAGGPTPAIERALNTSTNRTITRTKKQNNNINNDDDANGMQNGDEDDKGVDFILTDLHPHLPAWHAAARQSSHVLFVHTPVDASRVPPDLLSRAVRRLPEQDINPSFNGSPSSSSSSRSITTQTDKKQFRLFSLALHHFDDPDAAQILQHALRTSSGFGIFELQARTFESMALMALFGPLMWAGGWWWFWGQWDLLFWTYILPVVPFVVVYDGVISSLRTRTPRELMRLMKGASGDGKGGVGAGAGEEKGDGIEWEKWRFESGVESHTWLLGEMNWFVGVKEL